MGVYTPPFNQNHVGSFLLQPIFKQLPVGKKNSFREDPDPLNQKRMFVAQSAQVKLVRSFFSLGFTGNSGDQLGFF